jgi:hypothetical protein
MNSAASIRLQIEAALQNRIPSALTPVQKVLRPVAPTGVLAVDKVLQGGLPLGAIAEIVGPECSGRTSVALSFIAGMTRAAKVCAWVDVLNMLNPESATAAGVDLSRLLWVRCGVQKVAVKHGRRPTPPAKPWARIEQALRVTDLLLQAGGFSAIVLDLASIAPEHVSRVPLATWFRYRAAAERTQASILLLTQHSCAASSAELLLRFQPGNARRDEATVFTGIEHRLEVARRRFMQASTNVVPLRKPPQRATGANWRSQAAWVGPR